MADDYKPQINVLVSPEQVSQGQMISIQAYIFDKNTGIPMAFDTIFLEIIDERGIPVWPLSTVEENSATISKLISTAELETNQDYTVRISPSRKLSPIGTAKFRVEGIIPKALLIPAFLLIPPLLLSDPDSRKQEKIESLAVEPLKPPKIEWLIFKTERDSRVCQYCAEHEGERYRPDDPELPRIPIHPRCRCHYDVISADEAEQIYQAYLRSLNTVAQIYQDHFDAGMAALTVWHEKHK